ncbi:MAG: hypothetical protein CUN55_20900, partial [Phototrophicales bacterium]
YCMLIIVCATMWSQNTFAQDWQLARDKKGIKVYTRKDAKSSIKDSKAVMIVKSNPRKALRLMLAADNHYKWMDRVVVSRTLKRLSDTEFYAYYEAGAPWPVSNRDVISHYT